MPGHHRIQALLTGVLLLLFGGGAAPPRTDLPAPSHGHITFTADVATTRAPDGSIRAAIYLELPYQSLRFSRQGGEWVSACDITAIVYGRKNEQVSGDVWTVPLRSPFDPDTRDVEEHVYRRRFDLPAAPGKLRFEVKVNQLDTGREGDWSYSLEVPRYDERPLAMSDLLFGLCAADSQAAATGWADTGFVPWTRRRYGNDHPLVCVRGEIFDNLAASDSTYRLACQIVNATGRTMASWTEEVPRSGRRAVFQLHPSIVDLTLGSYRLKVEAALGQQKVQRERTFEVDESRISVVDDPRMIRSVLGYVARNEELIRLEDLPADSLQAFWDAFWQRRDPSPANRKNERLTEFLRRLEYVNQHFSILEPGWSSDMGRIYIRYGAPDEIDKTPYSNIGPPREVWYYVERQLRFVFVDTEGFGRFRLLGPQGNP